MTMPEGTRSEHAFIEAIRLELAGGSTLFGRDTVQTLIRCYLFEVARFEDLAHGVAYNIEQDETYLRTNYEEFTARSGGDVIVDTVAMRDQIDRYAKADKERRDAKNA